MADRILVALDETRRIHRFMAHLKLTAQPGDTIIFLIRAATSTWGNVETHLPMIETGSITSREYRGSAWRFNVDQQKDKAEHNLASACEALPQAHFRYWITQIPCHTSLCGFGPPDVTRPVRSGRRAFACLTLRVGAHPA